jgi:hypothetical protein
MPWVRIDENAMDHPKIGALPDGAFRLWVQALAYCQKHLTDGYVSHQAIRAMRAFSPKRRAELESAGLWDRAESGIQVHDYLVWNESRETVTQKRDAAKERMRLAREKRSRDVLANIGPRSHERAREVLRGVVCSEEGSAATETWKTGSRVETPHHRAGAFCQWYEDTHQRLFGVGYMGTQKDFQKALELVDKFTDEELRDGALVWFGMEDDFATQGTRTIPKFASRITGCLEQARKRGIA